MAVNEQTAVADEIASYTSSTHDTTDRFSTNITDIPNSANITSETMAILNESAQ